VRILRPFWVAHRIPEVIGRVCLLQVSGIMREPSDARKRTIALQERALRFSAAVNSACPKRCNDLPSSTVWGQLVRAADSMSSNLVEADNASSTADFIHKMRLTLREAKESRQALTKLRLSKLDGHDRVEGLEKEADELAAIFATIVLKVSNRQRGDS
jgi:four helix bundle protein